LIEVNPAPAHGEQQGNAGFNHMRVGKRMKEQAK
jgi:ribosomal protein L11